MKNNSLNKTAWYSGNILLPLFETRMVLRAFKYVSVKKLAQVRELRRLRKEENQQIYTFEEAVEASGRSRDELLARYCFGKRLWLMLFFPCVLISLLLMIVIVVHASELTEMGWWRTCTLLLTVMSFSALLFCGALKSAYRHWQLQTERLGTFQEWQATERWLHDIFSW